MLKQLSISGFRGFGVQQTLNFALPDNKTPGSGLTIIVGANNTGKTTIIESIQAFNGHTPPSFSEGRRNKKTDKIIEIMAIDNKNLACTISTIPEGGGLSNRVPENHNLRSYVVPSRRAVEYEFVRNYIPDRESYITNSQHLNNRRMHSLDQYEQRLFNIINNRKAFDTVLTQVLGNEFKWTIELNDSGMYYIKYMHDGISHNSEGIGDGIWSVFTICAALFDAKSNDMTIIDEPELSIHPALQKRLMSLLLEKTKTMQIIICTHSPYFISWNAIINGANLIRTVKAKGDIKCYDITDDNRKSFKKLLGGVLHDINQPHTLGIEANEAFFLEDHIILVEGQEDVVLFNKFAGELNLDFKGEFFGWGAGGATKMSAFLELFKALGYQYVVAIYDGDKKDEAKQAAVKYPQFKIVTLEKDDIRDKFEKQIVIESDSGVRTENLVLVKEGYANKDKKLKPEHNEFMTSLIQDINAYLFKETLINS